MGNDGLSFDRVERLIAQLPTSSRFINKLNPQAAWSKTEYVLADLIDAVQILIWQNQNAGVKRNKWTPQPKPYARPGLIEVKQSSKSDLAKRLLEQKERLNIRGKEDGR